MKKVLTFVYHKKTMVYQVFKRFITNDWTLGTLFAAGILIAGSENPWFPWFNIFGALTIGFVGHVATRLRPVPWRE